MCEDIKYPEEVRYAEFDRLVNQMAKDRKLVERLIDRLMDCALMHDLNAVDEVNE